LAPVAIPEETAMPTSTNPNQDRPSNHEVENENQRPARGVGPQGENKGEAAADGKAPRPATEPRGAEGSSDSPKTRTDPGSGEA
jgi:hypothetical protein